jgi:hypothetical protein
VGSADGQTFLAQSPYVFYEGEKCKVVGTIHNSNDETNDLCVYPLEYRRAVCWFPLRLSIDKPIEISLLVDFRCCGYLLILFTIQNTAVFSQK